MNERRQHIRHKRRLSVRFGEQDLSKLGFTQDVSMGGLFVLSDKPPSPRARLHIQLFVDPDHYMLFEGMVVREKQVPPELRQVVKAGFGVRFLKTEELLAELAPADRAPAAAPATATVSHTRLTVEYRSIDELQRAYKTELKHGGVFVATDLPLKPHTPVTLEVKFGFTNRSFELKAAVLQAVTAGAKKGLALTFDDPDEVMRALRAYIPLL